MKMEKNKFDYATRLSLSENDTLGQGAVRIKLAWDKEVFSELGAHYHCWIDPTLAVMKQHEILGNFKKFARMHGDPVEFSYDFTPTKKRTRKKKMKTINADEAGLNE